MCVIKKVSKYYRRTVMFINHFIKHFIFGMSKFKDQWYKYSKYCTWNVYKFWVKIDSSWIDKTSFKDIQINFTEFLKIITF